VDPRVGLGAVEKQSGPVILAGNRFAFPRLLRLAGLPASTRFKFKFKLYRDKGQILNFLE
jgi:hypothetical protein